MNVSQLNIDQLSQAFYSNSFACTSDTSDSNILTGDYYGNMMFSKQELTVSFSFIKSYGDMGWQEIEDLVIYDQEGDIVRLSLQQEKQIINNISITF